MRLALLVVKGTHLGPNQVHECAIFTKSRHSNVCMAKIVQEIAGHAFAACVSNRVLTHTHTFICPQQQAQPQAQQQARQQTWQQAQQQAPQVSP